VPVLATLLVAAVLVGTPWKAAESALVVDILTVEDYPTGLGLRTATGQAAQIAGFAIGGIAIAAIGARGALALDAATFLISAALIRLGVRTRPPAAHPHDAAPGSPQRWLHGAATVLADRRLRLLLSLAWLLGLLVIPEGLAAPYAQHLGGGARTVGLLLAAGPTGVLVGTVCYTRLLSAPVRAALLGPLAAVAGIPLLFCATTPNLAITCLLWALSGACTAYQVQVVAEFVHTISPSIRGQGLGIASAGLLAAQGIGLLAGGAITQITSPTAAIVTAGAAATALGSAPALTRRAHNRATPAHLVGDNVLVAVADCLRRELRGHDGLGRYGGEEFVIILDRLDLGAAQQVADRLRAAVSALYVVDGLQITVSIGLAYHQSEHGPVDLNQLLTRADAALYQAKSSGRDRVQTY